MRWNYTPAHAESVAELARDTGTTPVVAELLLRAGLSGSPAATRFLQPALATLGDPFLLANLEVAADRLLRALRTKERVVVLGDYDVDGVCSTTILVSLLRRLGLDPRVPETTRPVAPPPPEDPVREAEKAVASAQAELDAELKRLGLDVEKLPNPIPPAPPRAAIPEDPLRSAQAAVAEAEKAMADELRKLGFDPERLPEAPWE